MSASSSKLKVILLLKISADSVKIYFSQKPELLADPGVLSLRSAKSESVSTQKSLSQSQKLQRIQNPLQLKPKTNEEVEKMIKDLQIAIKDDLNNASSLLLDFEKYYFKANIILEPSHISRLFVVSPKV